MPVERKGRFGEAICKSVMKSSGINYIPLCDISCGAPMAVSNKYKIVLPDFDVFGGPVNAYLDAKVKTNSVRWKKTGQVRHGINASNYEAYKRMGLLQRKQCGLFLVELLDDIGNWSGTIMSESFMGLGAPQPGFNEPTQKVYWPRDRFSRVGSYPPSTLLAIAKGEFAVDMAAILRVAFAAPPPSCPPSAHIDQSLWLDEPQLDRRGQIRTVCRKCGAFIGYRPA